jgi:signal transduction histidine kinase
VQEVDIHEGIDDTFLILRSKLKTGVEVRRIYGELPKIQAHGSELNQVWTNLLDNANDALGGQAKSSYERGPTTNRSSWR